MGEQCPFCRCREVKRRRCQGCGAKRRGELWTWTGDLYRTRPRRAAALGLLLAMAVGLPRGCASTPQAPAADEPCQEKLAQCEAGLALCESTPKD